MKLTLNEYIKFPYGKGSAFADKSKQGKLDNEYTTLKDRITSKIYLYHKDVIYHVLIPSNSNPNGSYDVIIEINNGPNMSEIGDMGIKVFSNCPSFIFTYANAFYTNDLLCTWLVSKYNKQVKKVPAEMRNRYGIIGLERSIYLAMKYLKDTNQISNIVFNDKGIKVFTKGSIAKNIRRQSEIMNNSKDKLTDTKEKTDKKGSSSTLKKPNNVVKSVKNTKSTKQVKSVKTTKKLKTTKTTKKI